MNKGTLNRLRREVWRWNKALPQLGLVTWTSGNVSGRDPATGLVAIKPSGVRYERLRIEDIVVVDLSGKVVLGCGKPSVDTATHLYVYRHRKDVMGVVHTHSTYSTAWAAAGRSIPVYLTAMADEFGGPISLSAYARIGGTEIGREIVKKIGSSPAILMKNHGAFTLGPTVEKAVKAAVMLEDVAKTCLLAELLGKPRKIPAKEVARGHKRYLTSYGQ